jgi:hypothetical protein
MRPLAIHALLASASLALAAAADDSRWAELMLAQRAALRGKLNVEQSPW